MKCPFLLKWPACTNDVITIVLTSQRVLVQQRVERKGRFLGLCPVLEWKDFEGQRLAERIMNVILPFCCLSVSVGTVLAGLVISGASSVAYV
ncbi:hypothetical protein TcWFU_007256 [Taenia crassiceps]|uniref:Uncharacterized protein n=1 Tax=Taenia crassiceps TaxID=6207 RepID=A0ABR4QSA7_9CEST